jgi:hypothetical protein
LPDLVTGGEKGLLGEVSGWRMRLAFQEIDAMPSRAWGELGLDRWRLWAKRSRLESMKAVARTVQKHSNGILAWFGSHISNGLIEGINSLVQAAMAEARGYRSTRTLSTPPTRGSAMSRPSSASGSMRYLSNPVR